jgi:hypothetical protein
MSRDEARKLLGGYATGSLTEAERRALFEAALEDQDLFDELAGEQALKEVLDEPGARQRLLTALEPPRHRAWLWGWAGAAATLAIVIGIVVSQRTPPAPQQIAQVLKSPEPVVTPAPPPAVAPLAPTPAPALRKVSPPAPPPEPPAETKAEPKKEEAVAEQLQQAKPQADAAAIRGFVAGAPAAAAPAAARLRAENAVVSAPNAFAFTYTVGTDGFLQVIPGAPGFLSVAANDVVIFPSAIMAAGTPVRIQIPPMASSLVIGFSTMPGIAGSPVRRDALAGRETDQDPPNGRILIQVFLTPATR